MKYKLGIQCITAHGNTSFFKLLFFIAMIPITATAQETNTKATPGQMVDALHSAFGQHEHARAVHAKGIILTGNFAPVPGASTLTSAPHLQKMTVPVTVRFSDFTGIPDIPDTIGDSNPRGLSIKFQLPDGSETDIVAHSFDGFPVATTDEFRTFLLAIGASGPTAAHPTPIEQFLAAHPIAKTFVTTQKPPSVGYATLSYFGVNAFKFTSKAGKSAIIRYQFIPEAGEQFLPAEQLKSAGPNYLSAEIKERVKTQSISFGLYAQIAEPGDKVDNPSIAWPSTRKRALLGRITLNQLAPNTTAEDRVLAFMPNRIPSGISLVDPMLIDRSRAYPISVQHRQ